MLGPTGKVLRLYRTKHVHALIAAFFSGIEVNAATGGPPAVWRSPKAAQTELELAGSPAVFPAQHLRLYHHDFPVQIILMGNGGAALRCDGAVVYALYAGLVEFYVGFLRLLGNPLAEQLHNLREIITGHHFAVFCK